jgi:hypothetical protein
MCVFEKLSGVEGGKWKAVSVEMDGFGKYVDGGEEM